MTGLEQSFYIVGIVCMSFILILMLFMVASIIKIRDKVTTLEKTVHERLQPPAKLPNKMSEIASVLKEIVNAAK